MTASAAAPSIDASVNPYWRRNLYVCLIGSFTNMAAMTLMLPFLPNYIRDLGVSDPDAIVFWSATAFSAAFLAAATVSPIWGWLADLYGRKPMLIRASLGMAVVMSMMGMAHNVYELVALRAATRLSRRLHLGLRHSGGEPDAEGSIRLGAGQALDRLAVRQPAGAADRRRAAGDIGTAGHLLSRRRGHFHLVSLDHVRDPRGSQPSAGPA